jgi:hypothetical protein
MEAEQKTDKKSSVGVVIIVILLLIILVLLFMLSPLKGLFFQEKSEPAVSLVVAESLAPETAGEPYQILVEAVVEGNPEPQLQFNRNDGIGQVEPHFTLVLLAEDETYLLTALAANELGTAEASIELAPGIAVGTDSGGSGFAAGSGSDEPATGDDEDEDEDSEDDADGGPEIDDGNNAPEIEAIYYEDDNISDLVLRGESTPVRYTEGRHNFVVIAADPDEDAIEFEVVASHSRIVDVTRVAVDSVAFTWLSPANPEGNLEALNVSLTVTAADPAGATDRQVIALALLPVLGEDDDAESADIGEPELVEVTYLAAALPELSGFVSSDERVRTGVILVGDGSANEMYKGFLTFNLAPLAGVDPADIIATNIRFSHVNKSGRPESFATWVDFKEFNYGDSLDLRDFAVGGTLFYKQRAESFGSGYVIQGSLITQIRQAIDAGRNRFQVKMGLDAGTNNNDADDFFQCRPENVNLEVTINDRTGRF